MAGIPAFVRMLRRPARRLWAWLKHLFRRRSQHQTQWPEPDDWPPATPDSFYGGSMRPKRRPMLRAAVAVALFFAGAIPAYLLRDQLDGLFPTLKTVPTMETACAGVTDGGERAILGGRWTGKIGGEAAQWDIYPGGRLVTGGKTGKWTSTGALYEVRVEGGPRFQVRRFGKTLCGIRYGDAQVDLATFRLTRTAYKLPDPTRPAPEAKASPEPTPSPRPTPAATKQPTPRPTPTQAAAKPPSEFEVPESSRRQVTVRPTVTSRPASPTPAPVIHERII